MRMKSHTIAAINRNENEIRGDKEAADHDEIENKDDDDINSDSKEK